MKKVYGVRFKNCKKCGILFEKEETSKRRLCANCYKENRIEANAKYDNKPETKLRKKLYAAEYGDAYNFENEFWTTKGDVYFFLESEIRDSCKRVKIGFTEKPIHRRLSHTQATCSTKIELLGKVKSNRHAEKIALDKLKKYNIVGEWFYYNKEVETQIEEWIKHGNID